MGKLRLRGWNHADLEQIADLWLELATLVNPMDGFYQISPDAREKYKSYLREVFGDRNYAVFVAEGEEGLVGFAMGRVNRNPSVVVPDAVGYIENIFVKEASRKTGVGKALCGQLLDWFRGRGVGHVELFYQIKNKEAEAFWKKMGFRTWLAKAYRAV